MNFLISVGSGSLSIFLVMWSESPVLLSTDLITTLDCRCKLAALLCSSSNNFNKARWNKSKCVLINLNIVQSLLEDQVSGLEAVVTFLLTASGLGKYLNSFVIESQIGWIFKSKANVSYCLYDSGPMVRHYALGYGFHTFPNLL